ncbi:kynureninase [Alteromonas sp. ASW11-19]|uniref:Kynureninase n=1 Tax=Alteromonas salexigens TaxID=2982530 RepID=A0ABT2VKV6_9ALTE|nr:kynureninase [Alteromonas salexigens]MCU7553930.1 kynureninase [Alteromonas salexigens]
MNSIKAQARELDQADPLAHKKSEFYLPEGVIYLDGNSLGALPHSARVRAKDVVDAQWGDGLITSWNQHGWIDLPHRVGSKLGKLLGAADGQLVCCDSISVNLFKLLSAALKMRPERHVIATTAENFPTDIYIAEGLIEQLGGKHELRLLEEQNLCEALTDDIAVLMITQVNFRTGLKQDMEAVTRLAHEKGILVIWDLAHSAGAFPVRLDASEADFAVGCTYKYLNGGPGAPAFVYVASRHQAEYIQPLSGWMGHAEPFAFSPHYRPAQGIRQNLSGTPGVIGMSILDAALEVFEDVPLTALREKSLALMRFFENCLEAHDIAGYLTPCYPEEQHRGSQLAFRHPDAYAICQAWIADGVIGDFRAPDILRIGFAPLYLSYADIEQAVSRLAAILNEQRYQDPVFQQKLHVT